MDQEPVAKRHPAEAERVAVVRPGAVRARAVRRGGGAGELLGIGQLCHQPEHPLAEVGVERGLELDVARRRELVGAVDERLRVDLADLALRAEPVDDAESNALRNQWLSEKPLITTGTSVASGSASASQAAIASASGEDDGERLPTTSSTNSSSTVVGELAEDAVARARRRRRARAPGGARQSISASATDGITFPFCEARAIVGTVVTRTIGSAMNVASSGAEPRSRSIALSISSGPAPSSDSPSTVERNSIPSGVGSASGWLREPGERRGELRAARCRRSPGSTRGRRRRGRGAGTGRRPSRRRRGCRSACRRSRTPGRRPR